MALRDELPHLAWAFFGIACGAFMLAGEQVVYGVGSIVGGVALSAGVIWDKRRRARTRRLQGVNAFSPMALPSADDPSVPVPVQLEEQRCSACGALFKVDPANDVVVCVQCCREQRRRPRHSMAQGARR